MYHNNSILGKMGMERIKNLNENDFSKANLEKFLTLAKLKEELMGE